MAGDADKATATRVLKTLRGAGYTAYFAGGCVRDMLRGARCRDYDIATDAAPQEVRRLFRRTLMVGEQFGVVVVLERDRRGRRRSVEVATFRSDLSYSDGRHPDGVTFASPEEDARRRDFTINGMFYDPVTQEVIDYVGGRSDLEKGVIRTIGSPAKRFGEDYLRMLRAVRFSSRLGFRIDPATARAITAHAPKIAAVSGERIFEELRMILAARNRAAGLARLRQYALARPILPELFDPDTLWNAGVERVDMLPRNSRAETVFGALFLELPAAALRGIARRWGTANRWRDTMIFYARNRDTWREAADMVLCDFKRLVGVEHRQELFTLWKIREKNQTGSTTRTRRAVCRADALDPAAIRPQPLVTGDDLIAMGMNEGKKLGSVLRELYDAQLNETLKSRKAAMEKAKTMIRDSR